MTRLEYNENQGSFYCNDGTAIPDKYGWMTICESLDREKILQFILRMQKKYKMRMPGSRLVKKEFDRFMIRGKLITVTNV